MDDLFPTFRYRKLVEHDCKYCQHLHHCHYTAVLEEDSGVTYCHHRGDSGSLADESIWSIDCIDTIGDRFSIRAELPDAVMPTWIGKR